MDRCRRPLILIALLLLAGAVVNVGVAWGIAGTGARPDFVSTWMVKDDGPDLFLFGDAVRSSGYGMPSWHVRLDEPAEAAATIRAGFGHWQCWEADLDPDRRLPEGGKTFAFGWPRPALRIWTRGSVIDRNPAWHGSAEAPASLISRGMFTKSYGVIPINPAAGGFSLNTLFYAVIVGAIVVPPLLSVVHIRRRLRARRGRCAKCGYDLTGLGGADAAAPCPECGTTLAGATGSRAIRGDGA